MSETNISALVRNFLFNTKLAILAAKAELKAQQDKIEKLQTQ